jgi:dTDP-4-dehydrorhamnose reductase
VHYSTDYVFDGTKRDPYTEEDTPHPLNAYGRSKLAGDAAIQASGCRHLIFRSSWIYGVRGGNFLLTMLRLAKERSELQIVNDQAGSPTWSRLLAQTTAFCVLKMHDAPEQGESLSGIYNLSCDGHTTWHGFASEIFRLAEMKNLCASPILRAVSTGDYPAAAQRPRQSRLDNGKLLSRFDISLPEWNHALQLCMDDLGAVRSTVQK